MTARALVAILISALCTLSMRALPFLLLGRKRRLPAWLERLGRALPSAIMAVLVIYCLKDGVTNPLRTGLHEAAGVGVTAASYIWKHNTLLSILLGTVTYMLAIRFLPI